MCGHGVAECQHSPCMNIIDNRICNMQYALPHCLWHLAHSHPSTPSQTLIYDTNSLGSTEHFRHFFYILLQSNAGISSWVPFSVALHIFGWPISQCRAITCGRIGYVFMKLMWSSQLQHQHHSSFFDDSSPSGWYTFVHRYAAALKKHRWKVAYS